MYDESNIILLDSCYNSLIEIKKLQVFERDISLKYDIICKVTTSRISNSMKELVPRSLYELYMFMLV
jgi:hypothetical protein